MNNRTNNIQNNLNNKPNILYNNNFIRTLPNRARTNNSEFDRYITERNITEKQNNISRDVELSRMEEYNKQFGQINNGVNNEYISNDSNIREKKLRNNIINIDSASRNKDLYPFSHTFKIPLPKKLNNISKVEILSMEFPNAQRVFTQRNNKIRWSNQYEYGDITSITIQNEDPVTGSAVGGTRTDKFIKIKTVYPVKDILKKGEKIKIVGLTVKKTDNSLIKPYSTVSSSMHGIGQNSSHFSTGNSHIGTITEVLNDDNNHSFRIKPSHTIVQSNSEISSSLRWGSGNNQFGEPHDYYNNNKIHITSGSAKNQIRRISDYTGLASNQQIYSNIDIESNFTENVSIGDSYEIMDDAYVIVYEPDDTLDVGSVGIDEFWIVDYATTLDAATYDNTVGRWYIDRDESRDYMKIVLPTIHKTAIPEGNFNRNSLSNYIAGYMNNVKNTNGFPHSFRLAINPDTDAAAISQKTDQSLTTWINHYEYNNLALSGFVFSVSGENKISVIYPSHGLQYGNILGIVKYPPTDISNDWSSTNVDKGWPISDLNMDLFGYAMIITDKSVTDWGTKNRMEENIRVGIENTYTSPNINGRHYIIHCPKTPYAINSRNNSPCYCYVIGTKIDDNYPTTYNTADDGSSVIVSTNVIGKWGFSVEVSGSTGVSGINPGSINGTHTVTNTGLIKRVDNVTVIDKTNGYPLDSFVITTNDTASKTVLGGGGLSIKIKKDMPFKLLFKNYIDDIGPVFGFTSVTDRKDTSNWKAKIFNTEDSSSNTPVLQKLNFTGDKYVYIISPKLQSLHDTFGIDNIFGKIPITGLPGELLFNPMIKDIKSSFDPVMPNIEDIELSIIRPMNDILETNSNLEMYRNNLTSVVIVITINKIDNYSINTIRDGVLSSLIELKSSDGKQHLLVGSGNQRTGNEKRQFKSVSITSSSDTTYSMVIKIVPHKDVDFNISSSIIFPINPIDIAKYIRDNIPVNDTNHPYLTYPYLNKIVSFNQIIENINPPSKTDYYDFNDMDYSITLNFVEEIKYANN